MVDIYQMHNKTGVSLRTLKKLDKHGYLKIDEPLNPEKAKIEFCLRKHNPLTAASALMLYQNQDWADEFGSLSREANAELAALGDVHRDAMPWEISSLLLDTASRDENATGQMARWLRQHMDASTAYAEGKPYNYIAVRILHDIPARLLPANLHALSAAVMQMRRHPAMEGYSYTNEKKRVVFQKPLDL